MRLHRAHGWQLLVYTEGVCCMMYPGVNTVGRKTAKQEQDTAASLSGNTDQCNVII